MKARVLFLLFFVSYEIVTLAEPKPELIFPLQSEHVHSSSIAQCPDGSMISVWFQGSGERRADDVRIMGARLKAGEQKWSKPFLAADSPGDPDCNPIIFVDDADRLWLFWVVVNANRWEKSILKYRLAHECGTEGAPEWDWQDIILIKPGDSFPDQLRAGFEELGFDQEMWAEYSRSYDHMLIESAKDETLRRVGWMPRAVPITLQHSNHRGRILLPLYSDGFNVSLVAFSDDSGETWQTSGTMVGLGNIQPTLAERRDGTIVAWMRDNGGKPKRVMMSESEDGGETWSVARDIDLPNPGSSLAVAELDDGTFVMALNDTERGRHKLSLFASTDEGRTWPIRKVLEEAPPDGPDRAGFGYPTICIDDADDIHLTYSYSSSEGATIKHLQISSDWINP